MCWIILGHTCYIGLNFADNSELRKVVEHQLVFQTIINGVYSVDTFFFISGFLVVFLYLRNNAKGNLDRLSQGVNEFTSTALHFCGLTSYRLARLTAPYLYMIGVTYVVMRYLADNMVFVPPGQDYINCPKYWWRNMLYINTFYPVQDMCLIWSWYLSNDTQFFIAGAIVLIVGVRHFKFATVALSLFLLSSWFTTGTGAAELVPKHVN
jgi:peptidoglycan/LPS O-acetylase OafA/YrhL